MPGFLFGTNSLSRHSGTRLLARARNPQPLMSDGNAGIEINPPRILFFDQTNLPITPPFLELFFASNSGQRIIVYLEPDKFVHAVTCRESAGCLGSMLVSAAHY